MVSVGRDNHKDNDNGTVCIKLTFLDAGALPPAVLPAAAPWDDCCAAVAPVEGAPAGIAKPVIIGGATEQ